MPIHDWTRVDAGIFHHFHQAWLGTIARSLNAGLLPPDYYALAEQFAGGYQPDVLTLESRNPTPPSPEASPAAGKPSNSGIALAEAPPRVRFRLASEPERYAQRRNRITVRHRSGDQVVAVLEIVCRGNKKGRHSLRSFVKMAVELLESGIHLRVVDLFPPGPPDPTGIHAAIWSELEETDFRLPPGLPLTLVSYSAGELRQAFIEPVAIGGPLTDMPLFLEPDRYILVPLEATYLDAFAAVPKRWRDELTP